MIKSGVKYCAFEGFKKRNHEYLLTEMMVCQDFLLLSGRHLHPRVCLHCRQQERVSAVPRLPRQETEDRECSIQHLSYNLIINYYTYFSLFVHLKSDFKCCVRE